jgi:putative addiction module component (TIGR02574 family)
MSAILDQIKLLSRTERLELVQEIWDGLAGEADSFELGEAQAAELDRRLAAHQQHAEAGRTLDQTSYGLGVRL